MSLGLEGRRQALIEDNLGFSYMFRALTGTASGTNAYTVTLNQANIEGYWDGMEVIVIFANANTGASTVSINGLGAIPIKAKTGLDVASGEIEAGGAYKLYYSSVASSFIVTDNATSLELPFSQSVLARWTQEVSASDVIDQEATSALTPRNLWCYDQSEAGVDCYIPKEVGSSASINFSLDQTWSVFFYLKSGETGVGTHRVINNRVWSGSFQGLDISHSQGGGLIVDFWELNATNRLRRQHFNGGLGDNITGYAHSSPSLNDGNWHPILITNDGLMTADSFKIYSFDTTGAHVIQGTSAGEVLGTLSGGIRSGQDWWLCNIPNTTSDDKDMQFQHFMIWDTVKTHNEAIKIFHKDIDSSVLTGCRRWIPFSPESGSTFHNVYVVATGNRGHAVATATGNSGNLNDGVYSYENKEGYTLSGSVVIGMDKNDGTVDADGTAIPEANRGKVAFTGELVTSSPFAFKPNPNDYDELTNLGITSSTTYTEGGSLFKNSELSDQLFKNTSETNFIIYDHKLRHLSNYDTSLDEKGSVMAYIGKTTYLVTLNGQSNTVGSNNTGVDDFVDSTYKDPVVGAWIANNPMGTVTQSVTAFEQYDYEINDNGGVAGPDVSFMKDVVDAGTEIYMYKYAIGATSLFSESGDTLNHWHPTQDEGTGTRLYPRMIAGLEDAVDLLTSTGRRVEVISYWGHGESDRSKVAGEYKAGLEAFFTALSTDIPSFNGKIIIQRGHSGYFDLVPTGKVREDQDDFVSDDTTNRKIYNSDAFATHDPDDVHFTIQGQEDSGQAGALAFLEFV